jgi:hypothetical protein
MKEDINIDELLNGYMDGELTDRHRTEVQRLISHDEQIAGRLRHLQKCRTLVTALPPAEVSGGLLERIKTSLETRTLVGAEDTDFDDRRGSIHLFARKLTTAAALIVLVAVLAAVVYNIAVPEKATQTFAFEGTLELGTSNVMAIENVINSAGDIRVTPVMQDGENTYVLTGSRQAVTALLDDMDNSWSSVSSSRLTVETKAGVQTFDISAKGLIDVINPPNPKITGGGSEIETQPVSPTEQRKVSLTIVVQESKIRD